MTSWWSLNQHQRCWKDLTFSFLLAEYTGFISKFQAPRQRRGPCSPLFLKSNFARDAFLEIHFYVILQGIYNFFDPGTPRISSRVLNFASNLLLFWWFQGDRSYLIRLNSLDIRSEVWRRSLRTFPTHKEGDIIMFQHLDASIKC